MSSAPSPEYSIIARAIDNAQVSDAQEQVLLDAFRSVSDLAVAAERERCARIAESGWGWRIAAKIRSGE